LQKRSSLTSRCYSLFWLIRTSSTLLACRVH